MSKKLIAVLLVALTIFSFAGCGGGTKTFDTGMGLTITLPSNMKNDDTNSNSTSVMYVNNHAAASFFKDEYDEWASYGIDMESYSVEDYIDLIEQANGIDFGFTKNANGDYFITYEKNVNGEDFFYYTTFRKSSDAFWGVDFWCRSSEQSKYLPMFEEWANSIVC